MFTRLQSLGETLLSNQVPEVWSEQWSGPEEPRQYCSTLAQKAAHLGLWVAAASTGQLWSQPLNLAHLFSPGRC